MRGRDLLAFEPVSTTESNQLRPRKVFYDMLRVTAAMFSSANQTNT
jgi:hypothetical protein